MSPSLLPVLMPNIIPHIRWLCDAVLFQHGRITVASVLAQVMHGGASAVKLISAISGTEKDRDKIALKAESQGNRPSYSSWCLQISLCRRADNSG